MASLPLNKAGEPIVLRERHVPPCVLAAFDALLVRVRLRRSAVLLTNLRVLVVLVPTAAHVSEQYSNNRIEADHGRLKVRLRPMRGLKRFRSAALIAAGHAFVPIRSRPDQPDGSPAEPSSAVS